MEPLNHTDCDLRDFRWMKLDLIALFNSTFNATPDDTAWRAGVTLWGKAWHQVPAGSLPNNDAVLCHLSGLGRDLKTWERIKDDALHGFVLCSDGRLYHSYLCQVARAAKTERQRYEEKRAADRDRKKKRHAADIHHDDDRGIPPTPEPEEVPRHANGNSIGLPSEDDVVSTGIPPDEVPNSTGGPTEFHRNLLLEGEGERKERKSTPPTPPSGGARRQLRQEKIRSRIPPDWWPDAAGIAYAEARNARHDKATVEGFRNHHTAHGSLMASWNAAWRTWCDNAERFGRAIPCVARRPEPSISNPQGRVIIPVQGF